MTFWISNLLMDVGVPRTKLGCTVLSAVSWIVSYRPNSSPRVHPPWNLGPLAHITWPSASGQVGPTGLSQGSSNAQSKGLTQHKTHIHTHTHNTNTNTNTNTKEVGQVKL